jgi:predicted SAM-dependent methyltransferase
MPVKTLKQLVVRVIGRERANRISGPYHDWVARRRTRRFLRGLPATGLLVNLGCGPCPLPGWVNVDRARNPRVDVVWDLAFGLPFPAASCSAIFAEHVIEHLSQRDADLLVRECYRALEPKGVIRLSTPDAGRYLRSYVGDGEFLRHPGFARTIETPLDRINLVMRQDGQHLWAYDSESLCRLLEKAGFCRVCEQQYGVSLHPKMQAIDATDRAFESLYVEGER